MFLNEIIFLLSQIKLKSKWLGEKGRKKSERKIKCKIVVVTAWFE